MNIEEKIFKNSSGYTWPINGEYTWNALNRELDHVSHIAPHLSKKNVMVQAGGNCGLVVRPFVDIFQKIYTFEPDPVNFYCLNLNLPFTNVNKIQACLGDSHQMVGLANIFDNDVGGYHVSQGDTTPTLKIDDLELTECDLIMLDVEGYELNALRGGIETIKKYKPVICVEVFDEWLSRFDATSIKINDFFNQEINYTLVGKYSSDHIYVPK